MQLTSYRGTGKGGSLFLIAGECCITIVNSAANLLIISPTKNYTLQVESALEQMDWIEKITGVIASLLSSQIPCLPASPMGSDYHRSASESSSFEGSDFDHSAYAAERSLASVHLECPSRGLQLQQDWTKNVLVFTETLVYTYQRSGLSHWMQVWEPSVISLFQSLGNAFANTVWEELLESRSSFQVDLVPTG
ncbi:hypothetical protein JHK82_029616 [Glycine max]|nr:hypothetical protein JHK86_029732 [Glycine max]KAG5128781.1 hypothetical protein JHK82_029616 [Glycine max]KAG5153388.1 hypothetical protein JHK84_029860 [Glycine max]